MKEIKQKRTREELIKAHAKLLEICCVKDDQIDELKNANLVLQGKLETVYKTEYKNKRMLDISISKFRLVRLGRSFNLFKRGD